MFHTKFVEKIKTHILCSGTFFFVYEMMWKFFFFSQATIWRMRIACWIPKATNTHSGYVILNALPQQQWLQERPSVLLCVP
jgi:hypothetical protein